MESKKISQEEVKKIKEIVEKKLSEKDAKEFLDKTYIKTISVSKMHGTLSKSAADQSWERLITPNKDGIKPIEMLNPTFSDKKLVISFDDNEKSKVISAESKEGKKFYLNENNRKEKLFPAIIDRKFNDKITKEILPNLDKSYKNQLLNMITEFSIQDGEREIKGEIKKSKVKLNKVNQSYVDFHKFYSNDLDNIFRSVLLAEPEKQVEKNVKKLSTKLTIDPDTKIYGMVVEPKEFEKNFGRTLYILNKYPFASMYLPISLLANKFIQETIMLGIKQNFEGKRTIIDFNYPVKGYNPQKKEIFSQPFSKEISNLGLTFVSEEITSLKEEIENSFSKKFDEIELSDFSDIVKDAKESFNNPTLKSQENLENESEIFDDFNDIDFDEIDEIDLDDFDKVFNSQKL